MKSCLLSREGIDVFVYCLMKLSIFVRCSRVVFFCCQWRTRERRHRAKKDSCVTIGSVLMLLIIFNQFDRKDGKHRYVPKFRVFGTISSIPSRNCLIRENTDIWFVRYLIQKDRIVLVLGISRYGNVERGKKIYLLSFIRIRCLVLL